MVTRLANNSNVAEQWRVDMVFGIYEMFHRFGGNSTTAQIYLAYESPYVYPNLDNVEV